MTRLEGFALGLALLEFDNQGMHGREIGPEAVVAGLDGQGDSQVGLADTRRPKEDHVLVLGEKAQVKKLHDRLLVQVGMKGEIVLLYGLGHEEPSGTPMNRADRERNSSRSWSSRKIERFSMTLTMT